MAVRILWVGVCVSLALSWHNFQCNQTSSIYFSLITVFHDISTHIQQCALIGKIIVRWHLAIAITSNIARSKAVEIQTCHVFSLFYKPSMQNYFLLVPILPLVPMDHRFDESFLFVYSAFLLDVKANLFCIDGL